MGFDGPPNANPAPAAQAFQQNLMIRRLWVDGGGESNPGYPPALDMWQPLNPVVPGGIAPGGTITQQIRNVGLQKRVLMRLTMTIVNNQGGSGNLTLTPWGLPNLISQLIFTDLSNYQRINTTGWHLFAVSTAKRRFPFGAATTTDTPAGYGDIFTNVQQAPASINSGAAATAVQLMLEIPFSYSDRDLRGAIWGSVTQATMQLQITLNPNMFVTNAQDPTLAVYQSSNASLPTITNVACQLYLNYLDQGPRIKGANGASAPLLPNLDIGTGYLLNNTASGQPVANQDLATPFVNSRQYLSIIFGYNNAGTLNIGTDINRIKVQSANLTNVLDVDPQTLAFFGRNIIRDDFPKGMYYLDFRHRPIDTNQFGNYQWVVNPSNVGGATATLLSGNESMGFIGLVNQGGALPSQ